MVELIQYVDSQGVPTGETEEKLAAHHAHTRRHLAFSLYLFDEEGKFLVTRRALSKKVWPGVWTNSCCGHPAPGESFEAAILRRLRDELGITGITALQCILPDYTYSTPPFGGIVENEFCPVYVARMVGGLEPNPHEVEEYKWLPWREYTSWLAYQPDIFSYWCKDQLPRIENAIEEFIGIKSTSS